MSKTKLPDNDRRDYFLRVRLNADERQAIEALARRLCQDTSTMVREDALKKARRILGK